MAKTRATGADAVMLLAKETTYGTPPDGSGGGVYRQIPLKTDSIGGEQGREDDPLWNKGTNDDGDAALGAFNVNGDFSAPIDARGVGFIMLMALAAAVSANNGNGTYTHTFKSGKDLFSYSKQVRHPKLTTPKARTQYGLKANGFSFPLARNGRAVITVPMIGQGEVKDNAGAARDTDPLKYAYLPFDNAGGAIKVGGSALGNVTGAQVNFSNGLEAVETLRADMMIDGVEETTRSANGTIDVRLATDATIDDLVDGNTPAAVEFYLALAATPSWKLQVQFPRVFFDRVKKPVTGPGGIQQTLNWRAAYDATAGYMMAVLLTNDVTAYT